MDKKKLKELIKEYKNGAHRYGFEIGQHFYELKKYKKVIPYFEKYLESKDYYNTNKAGRYLGDIYYKPLAVKRDVKKALKYYEYAKYKDDIAKLIAEEYYYGRNVPKNLERAYEYYAIIHKKDVDILNKCIEYCKEHKPYNLYNYYKQLYNLTNNLEAKIYVATARFIQSHYSYDNIEYTCNLLKELEDSNNKDVMYSLGVVYYEGLLGQPNKLKAFEYFKKAESLCSLHASSYLGIYYYDGINVEKNIELAVKHFEAAKTVSNYAKYRLGKHMIEKPEALSSDVKSGSDLIKDVSHVVGEASWYMAKILREKKYNISSYYDRKYYIETAIKLKYDKGYVELGYLNLQNGKYEDAFNNFKYAYDQGIKEAEYPLSLCYKEGYGVEKDEEKAASLVENSNDHMVLYQNAKKLYKEKKYNDYIKILQNIVDQNVDAKYDLANYYLEGKHVKKNEELAYKYYSETSHVKKEAELKQYKLMYYGIGVKQNKRIAINNLIKLKQLDGEAYYLIGLECQTGDNLKKSLESALKYYEAAYALRYAKAKEKRDEVKAIIDDIKAKEVEKKAKEAKEKAIQDMVNKLKQEELEKRYNKYMNTAIFIRNLKFPEDYRTLQIQYTYTIYGELKISFDLKWLEKKAYLGVTGKVKFIGYMCKERLDDFDNRVKQYVNKCVDEFYEKNPDYPFELNINYNYICEYDW